MPKRQKRVLRDKYYLLAKEQGFRSRAAFKLIQLNKKYSFLHGARGVLDLCAAPGGWLQVAAKYSPTTTKILGVDLLPIRRIARCTTLVEDITTEKCRSAIRRELDGVKIDVVLHDGAPSMGVSWVKDAYDQSELTLHAMKLAVEMLAPGGWFVTKVFRSKDYNALLWVFKQLFKRVSVTKPSASRNTSAEIYVICAGYLAPKKLDPRFLNPQHVFKEVQLDATDVAKHTEKQLFDSFKKAKPRQREGYADGTGPLMYTPAKVSDFFNSEVPITILADHGSLEFDDDSKHIEEHPLTTADIRESLKDLRVLGARDIKIVLRWRLKILREAERKEAERLKKLQEEEQSRPKTKEEEDQELDEELERDLALVRDKLRRKKKSQLRKQRKEHKKRQRRLALKIDLPNDHWDHQDMSENVFELTDIKTKEALENVSLDADHVISASSSSEDESEPERYEVYESDGDYTKALEEELELQYEQFLAHKKNRPVRELSKREKKRAAVSMGDMFKAARAGKSLDEFTDANQIYYSDSDEEAEHREKEEEEANPLLVKEKADDGLSSSARAKMFFDRDIFADIDAGDLGDDDQELDEDTNSEEELFQPDEMDVEESDEDETGGVFEVVDENGDLLEIEEMRWSDDDDDDDDDDGDDDGEKSASSGKAAAPRNVPIAKQGTVVDVDLNGRASTALPQKRRSAPSEDEDDGDSRRKRLKMDDTFEIVSLDHEEYAGSSGEDTDLDDDDRAALLSMGKLATTGKRKWKDMVDDSYNRYAFADGDLPSWFVDDDKKHNKPLMPVTRQMINEIKNKYAAINARPIKKVAEAKARKKVKAKQRLDKVKAQANAIANDSEMSEKEKARALERLYKKSLGNMKPKKVYVVRRKFQKNKARVGPRAKGNSKVLVVDPRMKADKRGKDANDRRKKKKGRKKK